MMSELTMLDLCCCAGLVADGYMQAACELGINLHIVGIDIDPQPHYPYKFIQSDAIEFLARYGKEFNKIHASPPCQQYSKSTAPFRSKGKEYPDILKPIQTLIRKLEIPAVIENVPSAPIRPDVKLVGYGFGLPIIKKRFFELHHWFMLAPIIGLTSKQVKKGDFATVVGKGAKNPKAICKVPGETIKEKWRAALFDIIERLQGVIIENRTAEKVMTFCDSKETLYYLDPPYLLSTRHKKEKTKCYSFEMSDSEHEDLCNFIKKLKGMVIISGYQNDLYNDILSGWTIETFKTYADGAKDRVEVIWMNPAVMEKQGQLKLF